MDVDLGLGAAVAFNIIVAMCRVQRPNASLLGQVPATDVYIDTTFYQKVNIFFIGTHFKTLFLKFQHEFLFKFYIFGV
jgi:hypothetical protein